MFIEKLAVLGDVSIIEIGYAKVKEYIEKERKIENGEIKSIVRTDQILDSSVNTKYPEWFNQEIK
jgi:hypothetical protein